MKYIIGVDVGGFDSEIILIKKNKILKFKSFKTPKQRKEFLDLLLQEIDLIMGNISKKKIDFIGVCAPGPVNSKKGILINPPNLKNCQNLNLVKIIGDKFKIKTFLENDANCAAIISAEIRNVNNLVFLTLGTGLGSGVVINKKLYKGKLMASEIGHTTINFDGLKCSCGNIGCFEQYVSIRAMNRYIDKYFNERISIYELRKKVEKGDKKALKVCDEFGKYLGIGLANVSNIFDPEIIVLGGGLSNFGKYILNPTLKEMKKRVLFRSAKVEFSRIKNVCVRGACLLNQV